MITTRSPRKSKVSRIFGDGVQSTRSHFLLIKPAIEAPLAKVPTITDILADMILSEDLSDEDSKGRGMIGGLSPESVRMPKIYEASEVEALLRARSMVSQDVEATFCRWLASFFACSGFTSYTFSLAGFDTLFCVTG